MTNLFHIQTFSFFILSLTLMIMIFMDLHPIILMIILIYWNIILILNMSLYKSMFISPIMFFIIMISGLLISLLYFASMISNEKSSSITPFFSFKLNTLTLLILSTPIPLTLMYYEKNKPINFLQFSPTLKNLDHNVILLNTTSPVFNFSSLYTHPLNNLTTISILYLLISLMTIIKICSLKNMSMRKLK